MMISASTNRLERRTVMRSASRREVLGECREVVEDLRARRQPAFLLSLLAFAGEHEDGLRARRGRGFEIAQRVADHVHAIQRDVEATGDLEEHAGLGLAALAFRVGCVRTEEERIDAPAELAD